MRCGAAVATAPVRGLTSEYIYKKLLGIEDAFISLLEIVAVRRGLQKAHEAGPQMDHFLGGGTHQYDGVDLCQGIISARGKTITFRTFHFGRSHCA